MKIFATTRTRNEEKNIVRFVMSYQWVDKVLIADGGSEDDTVKIAKKLPNTEVRVFDEKAYSNDKKVWRNPHGKHINFIIDWAEAEGADWIIFDDCDCVPNSYLKSMDDQFYLGGWDEKFDYLMVTRIYLYRDNSYLRKLTCPTGDWTPSLWAWKANKGVRAKENNPWEHYIDIHNKGLVRHNLMPPCCLLHYFCPDDETVKRKLDFYSHMRPGIRDPIEYGGARLPLEKWMRQ